MAVHGDTLEEVDDDEIARIDTMCTSILHGDGRLERFSKLLRKRYGLTHFSEDCSVPYLFGGGDHE
eukprot:6553241-Prorocentrum_lima.AAC.1